MPHQGQTTDRGTGILGWFATAVAATTTHHCKLIDLLRVLRGHDGLFTRGGQQRCLNQTKQYIQQFGAFKANALHLLCMQSDGRTIVAKIGQPSSDQIDHPSRVVKRSGGGMGCLGGWCRRTILAASSSRRGGGRRRRRFHVVVAFSFAKMIVVLFKIQVHVVIVLWGWGWWWWWLFFLGLFAQNTV